MKDYIENGLALAGALIVLLGVTFAAGGALADDEPQLVAMATIVAQADEMPTVSQASAARARKAQRSAARAASRAIIADQRLDLDIRLAGRNSTNIAGAPQAQLKP